MSEPVEQPTVTMPSSECTVCTHEKAAEIDADLLSGTPMRTVAGTYGLARSSVGRHRQNHLSAQTITEPPASDEPTPALKLVDVHGRLAALVDRLEEVVKVATRTRKAAAAVQAMREQRQALEAIARLQADPELQRAAAIDDLQTHVSSIGQEAFVGMLDFVLSAFGHEFHARNRGDRFATDDQAAIVGDLMAQCLRTFSTGGIQTRFADVDTSRARTFVERRAVEQADRMEAEVRRRVEAELARRERQSRPAIEGSVVRAIEGSS
ncbi:hypothetical protein [uncultured Jatrophihabitans sp.]|uniref:hypothetical protein n=1 Tax=uncultured Jatrophihabitans sp. TaxID=1610747 RepID=UPI0035C97AD1